MYVCVCKAVNETRIVEAVANGASHLRDLRHQLGVSSECGQCAACAKQCLKTALAELGRQGSVRS